MPRVVHVGRHDLPKKKTKLGEFDRYARAKTKIGTHGTPPEETEKGTPGKVSTNFVPYSTRAQFTKSQSQVKRHCPVYIVTYRVYQSIYINHSNRPYIPDLVPSFHIQIHTITPYPDPHHCSMLRSIRHPIDPALSRQLTHPTIQTLAPSGFRLVIRR